MTLLTGGAHEACTSSPALRSPARGRKRCLSGVLADPRVRLGAGAAALLVTAIAAHQDHVGKYEAAALGGKRLAGSLYQPAWAVMQLGTFGAAPAAASVAWLAGDRELAGRLLTGGIGTWALSKVFKQMVRRPRPAALIRGDARPRPRSRRARVPVRPRRRCRRPGRSRLPPPRQSRPPITLSAAPLVGLTRIYVGAHLPLDVAGGAALGFVVEALTPGRRPVCRHKCATARSG